MKYDMIDIIMRNNDNCDIINFKSYSFQNNLNKLFESDYAHGVSYYSKRVFDIGGGFQNWKCAADTEFYERVKKFIKTNKINYFIFFRRFHENNLTTRADTGHNSLLRNNYIKQIKEYYSHDEVKIDKIINEKYVEI
jgi:hypothetical protein